MRLVSIETRDAPFIEAYRKSAIEQGYDLVLTKPNPNTTPAFEEFKAVYKHYSDNPFAFELNCFRRYFDALEYAEPGKSIIISDTDQLLFAPPTKLPEIFFERETLVGSRGITAMVPEMDVSPHFSKWPSEILRSFTEFLIYFYSEHSDDLLREYNSRKLSNDRSAVSDMTLFSIFIAHESVPFYNSNSLKYRHHVDHNFSMTDTADGSFRSELGFKAFRRDRNGELELITSQRERIRPISLHLQGRAKVASKALRESRMFGARARLLGITLARKARGVLR